MSFSLLEKIDTKVKTITPSGLDKRGKNINYMYESVNLEYDNMCSVRSARKLLFPFTELPDQVITCGERIFLRYINNMNELVNKDGTFDLDSQISLKPLSDAPDRTVIEYKNKLYIFPDQLIVEPRGEPWTEFAPDDDIPIKFNFVNAYGLFFTNGYDGKDVCYDVGSLMVGCEIKFSWHSEKNFTVVKKEEVYILEEDTPINVGTVFWLNAEVRNYNTIPARSFALVRYPYIYKAPKTIYFGYGDRGAEFVGNTLNFSKVSGTQTYIDPDVTQTLFPGMTVKIEGATKEANNTQAKITYVSDNTIVFDRDFENESFRSGSFLKITPVIPTTDHAAIIDNRLFIADNESGKISISRYEEPLVFCGNEKTQNGSFELSIKEPCTGLVDFKNQPHCFTPNGGFKIYESKPGEVYTANLQVGGIPTHSCHTLCNMKDNLLYFSDNGVMKYSGGTDSKISNEIKASTPISAVALGERYYILDENMIYVYSDDRRKWWAESCDGIKQLIVLDNQVCFVKKEGIYAANGSDYPVEWSLCSTELGDGTHQQILPIGIKLLLNSEKGCEISASVRHRGEKVFKNVFAGFIKGESAVYIPLGLSWSDGFYFKLKGKGDAVIEKFVIKYRRKPI